MRLRLIVAHLFMASALCLLMTACAVFSQTPPHVELPALRLAPAALGRNLALEQRLVFTRGEQRRELDALLEVDASQVRLLVQAMGQSAVRLVWDGQHLDERRAPWLPPQVSGERVLDDLQFAVWPLPAVRAALPAGWQAEEAGNERRLRDAQGQIWLIAYNDGGLAHLRLRNFAGDYELEIHSMPVRDIREDAP